MNSTAFAGQSAIVTGAGSGIGRAIAVALARAGAIVQAVDLTEAGLRETASSFPNLIRATTCDLREVSRWEEIIRSGPRLDVLVNCAGVSTPTDLLNRADDSLTTVMAVNFGAAWHGCREAARRMGAQGGGRIVNISSVHSQMVGRGMCAYDVSKAALEQFTRCLAVELADRGILVNAVAPGFVDTPMSRATGVNELETDEFRVGYVASGRLPLRRAAQPEEIAAPVLFLASRENTYVTGHVIVADGGLSLTL